jgi:hypothetical protein
MKTRQSLAYRFFTTITAISKTIITLAFLIIIATAAFIPMLKIDSRAEYILFPDDPALLYLVRAEANNFPLAHSFAGDKK